MNGLMDIQRETELANFKAVIQYEKPNINLYDFTGKLIGSDREYPIINDNILLRGCNLRVAPVIYGKRIRFN